MRRKKQNVLDVVVSSNIDLKIDYCDHKASLYACQKWHYTKKIPVNKLIKIGVWENKKFIGTIIFGLGASAIIHKQFNLKNTEVCELVRVALNNHITPVTKIISISLKLLKRRNPKLKVCVSFADPSQNHLGIIYQAGNWIFSGKSADTYEYYYNKDWRHVTDIYKRLSPDKIKLLKKRKKSGKFRYIMPLTKDMKKYISKLAKPYPKKDNASVV